MRKAGTDDRDARNVLDDVGGLRSFVSVVETQGISAAARRLHLTPSTVSKHISQLEERLGVRLVNRTTRHLSITEMGARLYEHALKIMQELEAAEAEILELDRAPKGRLRVTAPPIMAAHHFGHQLPLFARRYPEVSIELLIGGQFADLVNEGVDVALRIAPDISRQMQSVQLAPIRRAICAAPAYLDRHGAPATVGDLAHHNCLLRQMSERVNKWSLKDEKGPRAVHVDGNFTADNVEILRAAVIGGMGIGLLPTFVCWQDLLDGRLIEILPGSAVVDSWLYAVVPHRRHMPSKTRAFIDFIAGVVGDPPYWDAALSAHRTGSPTATPSRSATKQPSR